MPRARICSGRRPAMLSPLNRTFPPEILTSPEIARKTVDFPAPFGPTRHTISPSWTDRLTPQRMSTPGMYPATTFSSASMVGAPQVGFQDNRVVLDLGRLPFADLLSVIENDDILAEIHHQAHIVLDHQECLSASVEFFHERHGLFDHDGIDPSGRFVE